MRVGDDDANEGTGPGECPGHEFVFDRAVRAPIPGSLIGAFGMATVSVCRWCPAESYEPSRAEGTGVPPL